METKTLYLREGSSDKQYTATLDGGTVTFAWGRRGSTLQGHTKRLAPESARKLYQQKLAEKVAKGYTAGEDAPELAPKSCAGRATDGPRPMLLNAITAAEVETLLDNDGWVMQEKADGVRAIVTLHHASNAADSASRNNLPVALTTEIVSGLLKTFHGDAIIDTEVCGSRIVLLDILHTGEKDIRTWSCDMRMEFLKAIAETRPSLAIHLIPSFTKDKRMAMRLLRETGAEGVVFKKRSAPYTAGRPNSGGDGLKFKFKASATVIVIGPNKDGKRSVDIAVFDKKKLIHVGSVGIPAKHGDLPLSGTLIEVEYLYAHRGGDLIQAVYKGLREDLKRPDDAKTIQYKGEAR